MSQAARLFQIYRRLSSGKVVTAQRLQEELEVSRATIYRDMAVLRDQLLAPIEWDAEAETYRLEPAQDIGDKFVVPGMHLTAREIYGMLTVVNLASALDPGVAGEFRRDYTKVLKKLMDEHEIRGYSLHEKLVVDLPQPGPQARSAMRVIGPALVTDTPIRLFSHEFGDLGSERVRPRRLRLDAHGWWLDYELTATQEKGSLLLDSVYGAEPEGP